LRTPLTGDARGDVVRAASDPGQVGERLAAWFATAGRPETIASVAIDRVFYVPGAEFTAVYSVTLRRGATQATQVLSGSLRYAGDDAELMAKAARRVAKSKFVVPELGEAVYHFPEWSFVLWTFPNDPKLRTLPACQRPETVRAALACLGGPLPANGNGNGNGHAIAEPKLCWQVGAYDQQLVRYIPRRRCVFRLDVEWRQERGADGAPQALPSAVLQRVYAKVYEDEAAAAAAHRTLDLLWQRAGNDGRWLRVPRPLYFDLEQLVLYQSALPGSHLAHAAGSVTPGQIVAIARGLALLQQTRLPLPEALSLDDELAKAQESAALVAQAQPQFAPSLESLAGRLGTQLPDLPRAPLVPCHGTFKLNHLLHDGAHIGLVDFDSMLLGDPLYDVANFTADLHYLEANGALPPGRAARLGRIFYDAWSDQVPWSRREAVLDWYVASLLLRKQALKPVKHLHPDATAKIGQLLAAAHDRLGG
jgi:hypothetical protein